jgi:hypothetical protein
MQQVTAPPQSKHRALGHGKVPEQQGNFDHTRTSLNADRPLSGAWPSTSLRSGSGILQTKLQVNDPAEQEADAVAEQVMRLPLSGSTPVGIRGQAGFGVQRQCAACAQEDEQVQRKPLIQAKAETGMQGGITAPVPVQQGIAATRGGGAALGANTRGEMEGRFGQNFGSVRIHTGGYAEQLSDQVQARAFTVGNDIYFNRGEYQPGTMSGQRLLAHELVHTVQQGAVGGNGAFDTVRGPHRLQRMAISQVGTAPASSCGSFDYKWKIALDTPAPADGFLVQEVNFREQTGKCTDSPVETTPIKPFLTYWESWKILKGKKLDVDFAAFGFTDNFAMGPSPNTTGTRAETGNLKFFSETVTGDLNTLWTPNAYTVTLPATYTQPSWWNNASTETGYHFANSWWNCCGKPATARNDSEGYP